MRTGLIAQGQSERPRSEADMSDVGQDGQVRFGVEAQ
jgi:hypothetical protein